MNRRRALLLLAAAAAAPAVAMPTAAWSRPYDQVKAAGSLRVAVYRDFAPFSVGKDNALKGIDVDLAAEIAKALGVAVDYMNLTAGETVDDDLRNAVWKGHYLGGGVADLMMHVPVDPGLALRNDNAVLFAPYYRERVAVLTDPAQTGGDDLVAAFAEHKVGVELDSLADMYMLGAYGGSLRDNVVHFNTMDEAVAAMRQGGVAGVVGQRSAIEGALKGNRGGFHLGLMPMPGLTRAAWPIGLAVKVNAHDLANAIEPLIESMVKDGRLARIFTRHGLTYDPPTAE